MIDVKIFDDRGELIFITAVVDSSFAKAFTSQMVQANSIYRI